jgi:hypothetical protein
MPDPSLAKSNAAALPPRRSLPPSFFDASRGCITQHAVLHGTSSPRLATFHLFRRLRVASRHPASCRFSAPRIAPQLNATFLFISAATQLGAAPRVASLCCAPRRYASRLGSAQRLATSFIWFHRRAAAPGSASHRSALYRSARQRFSTQRNDCFVSAASQRTTLHHNAPFRATALGGSTWRISSYVDSTQRFICSSASRLDARRLAASLGNARQHSAAQHNTARHNSPQHNSTQRL